MGFEERRRERKEKRKGEGKEEGLRTKKLKERKNET
jgi:hypothetical protein